MNTQKHSHLIYKQCIFLLLVFTMLLQTNSFAFNLVSRSGSFSFEQHIQRKVILKAPPKCNALAAKNHGDKDETKPSFNIFDRRSMIKTATSALLLASSFTYKKEPSYALSGLVHFPCTHKFMNTYHFMRAGQSLLESQDIISTNPLFLTNREDNALSTLGRQQARSACREMITRKMNLSVVKYSIAAKAMDTADIVASEMQVGRNRLFPEYTFLDPRGIGRWDMQKMSKTEEAVWALDHARAGNEGRGGLTPPHYDGTPNETLSNQVTRLTELISGLETHCSGDTILVIFPDGTGPALLSALIAGIPLNRVHELEFAPGEIRYDITQHNVLQAMPSDPSSSYEAAISRGTATLEQYEANPNQFADAEEEEWSSNSNELPRDLSGKNIIIENPKNSNNMVSTAEKEEESKKSEKSSVVTDIKSIDTENEKQSGHVIKQEKTYRNRAGGNTSHPKKFFTPVTDKTVVRKISRNDIKRKTFIRPVKRQENTLDGKQTGANTTHRKRIFTPVTDKTDVRTSPSQTFSPDSNVKKTEGFLWVGAFAAAAAMISPTINDDVTDESVAYNVQTVQSSSNPSKTEHNEPQSGNYTETKYPELETLEALTDTAPFDVPEMNDVQRKVEPMLQKVGNIADSDHAQNEQSIANASAIEGQYDISTNITSIIASELQTIVNTTTIAANYSHTSLEQNLSTNIFPDLKAMEDLNESAHDISTNITSATTSESQTIENTTAAADYSHTPHEQIQSPNTFPELQTMEDLVASAPFEIPELTPEQKMEEEQKILKEEKISLAEKAMDDYLSMDDGGSDWLDVMSELMHEEE